jgi:hypothetical protein
MIDIDDEVRAALRERAEGGVHVEALLHGARRRGVRRRRYRRVALAVGTAAVAVTVAGAVTAIPWHGTRAPVAGGVPSPSATGGPSPSATGGPLPLRDNRPPVAAGAPPLAQGGQVGADPRLFHLDVTDPAAVRLQWTAGQSEESLSVSRTPESMHGLDGYWVSIARSASALDHAYESEAVPPEPVTETVTVQGHPATLAHSADGAPGSRHATLRWQPVAGVWAQVRGAFGDGPDGSRVTDRAAIVAAAEWVRLDRTYRCAVGFRLAWAPPGAHLTRCGLAMAATPATSPVSGTVTNVVRIAAGGKLFRVETDLPENVGPVEPNTEVAGRKVRYDSDKHGALYVTADLAVMVVDENGMSRTDVLNVVGGFTPVTGSLTDRPDSPLP